LLGAVGREWLLKAREVGKRLSRFCSDLRIVEISSGVVITCSSKWCIQVVNKYNIRIISTPSIVIQTREKRVISLREYRPYMRRSCKMVAKKLLFFKISEKFTFWRT
jgi:hypothetical protein